MDPGGDRWEWPDRLDHRNQAADPAFRQPTPVPSGRGGEPAHPRHRRARAAAPEAPARFPGRAALDPPWLSLPAPARRNRPRLSSLRALPQSAGLERNPFPGGSSPRRRGRAPPGGSRADPLHHPVPGRKVRRLRGRTRGIHPGGPQPGGVARAALWPFARGSIRSAGGGIAPDGIGPSGHGHRADVAGLEPGLGPPDLPGLGPARGGAREPRRGALRLANPGTDPA